MSADPQLAAMARVMAQVRVRERKRLTRLVEEYRAAVDDAKHHYGGGDSAREAYDTVLGLLMTPTADEALLLVPAAPEKPPTVGGAVVDGPSPQEAPGALPGVVNDGFAPAREIDDETEARFLARRFGRFG